MNDPFAFLHVPRADLLQPPTGVPPGRVGRAAADVYPAKHLSGGRGTTCVGAPPGPRAAARRRLSPTKTTSLENCLSVAVGVLYMYIYTMCVASEGS